MTDVYIDHFSFALGEETTSVEQAGARGRLISDPSLLKEAGFFKHHTCKAGTTAYDLARHAVQNIAGSLEGVGAIVYSTCLPLNGNVGKVNEYSKTRDIKHLMDFPASHLQSDFGLDRAIVIGISQQACTGMLGSLRIARNLLIAEPDLQSVLCVTADRFPDDALYEQSYNLISDGAAACLVSLHGGRFKIAACHQVTNGAMAMASDDETVGSFFSYSHSVITRTLERAGLQIRDIKWIVPQNTNAKAWRILAGLLKFDFEKVYFPSLSEVAHVISGDNIINLKSLADDHKVEQGDYVLLFMAGYGLNWQCVILQAS
ncbi:MAG TPA: 3-oxoacyl-[acyl-carrier-protein] synthase III C-terminal domain-containing protein [Candidatus Obscuribacterales bacterium]